MRESANRPARWLVVTFLAVALGSTASVLPAQDSPVMVSIDVSGNAVPGGTVTATATVEITDGSTVQSFAWMQTGGAAATLSGAGTATVTATLGNRNAYKGHLFELLDEPPVTAEQLPPNVPLPPGEFAAGLRNRFELVGINPFALEEAGLVVLEVEVTTTSGTYHAEAEIHTGLPWRTTLGIRNVPIGVPILVQSKEQDSYDWTLELPTGSAATLLNAASRHPEFTPDVPGIYTLDVTDQASGEPVRIVVYAGTWRGVIVGQDEDGRPVADELCTGCHRPGFAPDIFPEWAQTGHAEIFTDNLNTSSHYSTSCFNCHMVGYDPTINNGGADEAPDYQNFLNAGLLSNPSPDNWTTVLNQFPATAREANIQCENCHGPASSEPGLDTLAHGWMADVVGEPRISLSADLCGSCHGEPLRHARFQQWQVSGHANFELAIDEGESGNCARCHTANGFLTWLPTLLGETDKDPLDNIEVTWTADEIYPQTCVTCHDPHNIGTTTGVGTNARVRISGNTPDLIAGFQVFGAGRGAMCMTCHNSRRGLRNDAVYADYVGTSEVARAPHGSSQTDMLMGENAYLVNTGVRGSHSLIADTCVRCHMEATPPPDILSYNQGGTNHTFFASPDICGECHGEILNAESIQSIVVAVLDNLEGLIEDRWMEVITEQIAAGNAIDIGDGVVLDDAADLAGIARLVLGESRGSQALTFVLADDTEVGPVALASIDVIRPAPMPTIALSDVGDEGLLKAGWNWALVTNDGSRGVHNPRFALQVLDASRDAVGGAGRGGPRATLPPEWMLE
jgi:hypothetical protein